MIFQPSVWLQPRLLRGCARADRLRADLGRGRRRALRATRLCTPPRAPLGSARRPDRLVRFLSVLRLRGMSTWLFRQEVIAVCGSDDAAGL